MKSILIIETPNNCSECPCYSLNAQAKRFECDANLTLKGKIGVVELDKKPRWCPLRQLPSFKAVDLNDTRDIVMFCHGWNMCLAEITGETE